MSGFRRGGGKKRRDQNEPSIVQALRAVGCQVWQLSGAGCPDLLIHRGGKYFAVEVKTATGTRTRLQADVPWPIVRDVDDALAVVNDLAVFSQLEGATR